MQFILWAVIGLFLAFVAPLLNKLNTSQAVFIIVVGLIFGPFYLNVVHVSAPIANIVETIVVLMLFSVGIEIRWSYFIKAIKLGVIVGGTGIVLSVLLGFLASYFISENIEQSVYLGIALSATSIGLAIPLLTKEGLLNSRVGQILLAAAIFDDIVALYLVSTVHFVLSSDGGSRQVFILFIVSLVVLVFLALIIYLMGKVVFSTSLYKNKCFRLLFFFITAGVSAWITHTLGMSSAVGGFVAGAAISLSKGAKENLDSYFLNRLVERITPIFFLSIGARITVLNFDDLELLWLSLLIVLAAVMGKLISPWIIAHTLRSQEIWLLGMALVPRAEVALIISAIGFEQGHLSHHGMVSLIIMTLATSILASVLVPVLARTVNKNQTSTL